jgi:hypothetical protein
VVAPTVESSAQEDAVTVTVLVSLLTVAPPPSSPSRQALAPLPIEREAARMLADEAQPFSALGDLADRLRAALSNPAEPAETSGRLALLWVRAMRRTLGTIPMTVDGTKHEPYRTWLATHDADVIYSEPAGQWLLPPDDLWRLHDAHRQTPSAEPLAWEVVTNGLPGECEGYPPCYLAGLDQLHAEYLRRHPRGAHVAEAVEQIRESNEQSVSLAAGPKGHEFFRPATDCVDLLPKARAVRAALAQAGADATAAIALLDKLRALCH